MDNTIEILKKLVSMPSYVNNNTNEKAIGNFIFNYLNQFPFLKVSRQKVAKDRFNIIAKTSGQSKLLIAGHMDTVEPKQGWTKDQFKGLIENDRLYGLGAFDTKGGVAAILLAIQELQTISGLTLFFYCDEEYNFQGLKKFINSQDEAVGEIAIFIEPTNLKIWNACRGLIEIRFSIQGKSGHSANPKFGKSAIKVMIKTLSEIEKNLKSYMDPFLGKPTLNIAYIRGGLNLGNRRNKIQLSKQSNNIPDFSEAVLEIRTTKPELRAEKIVDWAKQSSEKSGSILSSYSIKHDLGSLFTPKKECALIEKILQQTTGRIFYIDPKKRGYSDGQLLQEKWKIPVIMLGPSGAGAHGPNEWVDLNSLKKLRKILLTIIKTYCQ